MCYIITVLFIIDPRAEALLNRSLAIEEHWFNVAVEAAICFEDWEEEEEWGNEAQEAQSDPPSEGILASTNCLIMCGICIGLMYFLFNKKQ